MNEFSISVYTDGEFPDPHRDFLIEFVSRFCPPFSHHFLCDSFQPAKLTLVLWGSANVLLCVVNLRSLVWKNSLIPYPFHQFLKIWPVFAFEAMRESFFGRFLPASLNEVVDSWAGIFRRPLPCCLFCHNLPRVSIESSEIHSRALGLALISNQISRLIFWRLLY